MDVFEGFGQGCRSKGPMRVIVPILQTERICHYDSKYLQLYIFKDCFLKNFSGWDMSEKQIITNCNVFESQPGNLYTHTMVLMGCNPGSDPPRPFRWRPRRRCSVGAHKSQRGAMFTLCSLASVAREPSHSHAAASSWNALCVKGAAIF